MEHARERSSKERAERKERDGRARNLEPRTGPVLMAPGIGLNGIGNRALLSLLRAGRQRRKPSVSEPREPREHAASGAPWHRLDEAEDLLGRAGDRQAMLTGPIDDGIMQMSPAGSDGGNPVSDWSGSSLTIQPKLEIGAADNPFEHEADRVAEQVMRVPSPGAPLASARSQISCKCDVCEEGEERLQRKTAGRDEAVSEAPAVVRKALCSPGRPLDAATRVFFEQRFGNKFSRVRIHTDAKAAESARALKARAYTVGNDIVFDEGRLAPGTYEGRRLLAHELTHVVQQSRTDQERYRSSGAHVSSANFPDNPQAGVMNRRVIGVARQDAPPAGTPLSPEELFQIIVTRRAFTFSRGGAPAVDPAGVGRSVGPQAGGRLAGWSVFSVVQITDQNGRLVDIGYGEHTAYGAEHAEPQALRALENSTAGRDLRGGSMLVVVDQFPCPPGQADCMGTLRNFARRRGLALDIRVPQRQSVRNPAQMASPRSSAMGSQRVDFPQVQLVPLDPAQQGPAGGGPGGGGPGGGGPGSGPAAGGDLPTSTSTSWGGAGTKGTPLPEKSPPAVSAKALAAELAQSELQTRRMANAINAVRWFFGVWNAYNALADAAKAMKMGAATLAHGSPYWEEMQRARDIEANAAEFDQYYSSLNVLKNQMPSPGDPQWDSWSELMDIQFTYLNIERQLHGALESIKVARCQIDGHCDVRSLAGAAEEAGSGFFEASIVANRGGQIGELRDAMAGRVAAAVMMPVTSLHYADAMFFAEAGGKINANLLAARDHYLSVQQWLEHHGRMARAAIKGLELRLRELGVASQVFGDMSDKEVRSSSLDEFSFRR
jgi:hypothetical protein